MKSPTLLACAAMALALTGCQSNQVACSDPDVVGEEYIHQYGVPVTKKDWEARGRSGEIISKRKDGVTITRNFGYGVPHGETTYSFPNSHIKHKVETYEQGELVKSTTNYPTGLPMREEESTGLNGKMVTEWYESGTPRLVEEYEGTQLVTGKYFNAANELESEVSLGGGIRTIRDGYGQLICHDTIQDGALASKMTFHGNGAPKEVIPYSGSKISGTKKTFLPNGEPLTVESWLNGEQHGLTVEYRNGEKVSEVYYAYGKRNGLERRYRGGLSVEQEIAWKDGIQHGPARSYVGKNVRTDWFHDGRPVSRASFDQLNPAYREPA